MYGETDFLPAAIRELTLDGGVRLQADCWPTGLVIDRDMPMILICHHIRTSFLGQAHKTFEVVRFQAG
jgi:hypothetical protein